MRNALREKELDQALRERRGFSGTGGGVNDKDAGKTKKGTVGEDGRHRVASS